MEFFRIRKDIPFMKHALVFNVISLLTFVLAVLFLVTRGLNLSVEFTGGTLMEVNYGQAAPLDKVRDTLAADGYADAQVQNFGSARDVLIRLPDGAISKFIELAGEINIRMHEYVVSKLVAALNDHRKALNGARALLMGIAYKKDGDDSRESPSVSIMCVLQRKGPGICFNDAHIPAVPGLREWWSLVCTSSEPLGDELSGAG
jgi:hypothetical protein